MSDTMQIEIRTMTRADLEEADRILCSAFQAPASRLDDVTLYYELQPEGRFILSADGERVAIVGAIDYGPFAYIGTMAVRKDRQRQGFGRMLMQHTLDWLDRRGCPVSVLDASPYGEPLYRQLGFIVDEHSTHYVQETPVRPTDEKALAGSVRPMTAEDLLPVVQLDRPIFGANRTKVVSRLYTDLPGRSFVTLDKQGNLSGYLIARRASLGPWAANSPNAAEALLRAGLALPFSAPPSIRIPSTNPAGVGLVERYGFQVSRSQPHMHRGASPPLADHARLYGLVSYAIG